MAKAEFTKNYALMFGENPDGTLRLQVRDKRVNGKVSANGKVHVDMIIGGVHVEESGNAS